MDNKQEIRPFTHRLSYFLIALSVLYLVSNFAFISHCSPQFYAANEDKICQVVHSFVAVGANIPSIARPVRFLRQNGFTNRANVVQFDYLFSWISTLLMCGVMVLLSAVMAITAHDEDRRQFARDALRAQRLFGKSVDTNFQGFIALMLMASTVVFFDAFWGYFDLAKLAHVRNANLYRISIDLFLLLLFGIFFLVWGAKTFALRTSAIHP